MDRTLQRPQEARRARLIAPGPVTPGAWRITTRHRARPTDFAAARDFTRGTDAPFAGGSVYTVDPDTGTAWLVDVPYEDLTGAPFAYATQAERARTVARRDVDSLPQSDRPVLGLFSIGRCGSTLLSRVLIAAGAQVIDELDAFTALGPVSRAYPADRGVQDRLARMARGLVGHVATHAPEGQLVLKFRSQAMQAARAICATGLRPVLLTRRFDDWARSNAHHFPDDPLEGRIDALACGLSDMAALPVRPVTLDYAELLADPVAAAQAVIGPIPQARHAAIHDCLSRHSQSGTALSQTPDAADAPPIAQAHRLWADHADPAVLSRLGLTDTLTKDI